MPVNDPISNAPGPEPRTSLGVLRHVIRYVRDPLTISGRLFAEYGPVASIVRAPMRMMSPVGRSVLVATGAEVNREVLTAADRFHMYALPGPFYPDDDALAAAERPAVGRPSAERLRPIRRTLTGLFHVNDDDHRRHRRLLMPAFHKTQIDAYRDAMVGVVDDLLREWRVGEVRDVQADMTEITLRIATTTLFGEDEGDRGVELARLMQRWLVTMFQPAMLVRFDVAGMPYQRWLTLTRAIDERMVGIVRAKRARIANGATTRDMLSMLIAARDEDGSALDEDDLVGHTGVIFGAGHETSTNALAWTLFLLSQHPDVASDLVDELDGVLRGDAPAVDQLAKLPLLDAVVKESLRILPPVPLHPRLVARDTELGGFILPKHTELFLSIFHLHHDPDIFSEPRKFKPDRWSRIKPTTFEYNPFSAGPRMCIGAAFATMEIKIVLAMLLQRFRVELPARSRVDHRVTITLAPTDPLSMRVRAKDNAWRAAPRQVVGRIRELVDL